MRHSKTLPIIFLLLLVVAFFVPNIITVLGALSIVGTVLHGIYQLDISIKGNPEVGSDAKNQKPFVSVQVPIHSEPPSIVIDTLKSLLSQTYSNYEIIVFDNNTEDESLWRPVENFCNMQGIRFYHQMDVRGYKAGTLNICRNLMDERSEYIFTVDADYKVMPNCLEQAVYEAARDNLALVQFPQAYSNISDLNKGIGYEFRHFFSHYLNRGNATNTVLGTGTLSLVHVRSLDIVGGWPTGSITEDAELGTRFQLARLKSKFVNRTVGRGIMPIELDGLRKQRLRWVFGNFQTLKNYINSAPRWAEIKVDCVLQLTAWINFCGLSILLVALNIGMEIFEIGSISETVILLSVGNVSLYIVLKFLMFRKLYGNHNIAIKSLFSHLALFSEGAFGWWDAFIGLKKPFVRTNKFSNSANLASAPFGVASILLISSSYLAYSGFYLLSLNTVALGMVFGYATVYMVQQMKEAAKVANGNIEGNEINRKEKEIAI